MSNADSTTQGFADRVQSFVTENKRAILIGTALAVAAGGVALYASASSPPKSPGDKKDRRKKSVKPRPNDVESGSVIEEIPVENQPNFGVLTKEQLETMPSEERVKLAAALKKKGNDHYQKDSFEQAAEFYTRAINVSPTEEPVYYSNRGACYMNMKPPQFDLIIEDCDKAIALNKDYVKAINRRANALEALDRLEEALRDYTTATILDGFQNEKAAQAVERVLKKLSSAKAAEIIKTRDPHLPAYTFISAYFSAFRTRPLPPLPEEPTIADNALISALNALQVADYTHSWSFVMGALEEGLSNDTLKAEALNLRGTFKFLINDVKGAEEDLLESIKLIPSFAQSWVKIASVYMEQGNPERTFEAFEEAIKHNPNDPDIYYHRGQVHFIMNDFKQAAANYNKSTLLDDQFVFSHIQLAVAQYKEGQIANSMATFRKTLKAFPERSEPPNYYGELLLDQGRFQDAIDKFDRAIELEKTKTRQNVLPMVNKGLALFQWKQDIGAAEKCCQEALEIDPECEAAVATLAQLSLQQSKIDTAVELFKRQLELARSEPELANTLTYMYASIAQKTFLENYPERKQAFSAMAQAMVP
ncbi:mitochondrial outer membrane translocase receptor TOM70 [Thelephora terrestris]|uniref:Mitochondrial outer membrane translocase receptor TOM70 n=1 Tax=Thelephora terrestris TaxID=56493 RepID=A0A9P6L8V3_9AGAM|nr:mitochondrial outer membrane translocase receptor TOM70 [Thelephora terrestris]